MIRIFIGVDHRERAATNVLMDSIAVRSSLPLAITPLITSQLENSGLYWRPRDPKQSTDFSFTRFLVPSLVGFDGWAMFIDCDMLCLADIAELWECRDEKRAVMCVQHVHNPTETAKFLGEPQSAYPRKNWSSVMLFNAARCRALTPEFVNCASGLELHRFAWLESDDLIGALPLRWNVLLGVPAADGSFEGATSDPSTAGLLHWTLGGPWFKQPDAKLSEQDVQWLAAREAALRF